MTLEEERDELDAMCELLTQDVRVSRAVAMGVLEASQLQTAATLDLLTHIEMVGPTDALTKALIYNVRRALGVPAVQEQRTIVRERLVSEAYAV